MLGVLQLSLIHISMTAAGGVSVIGKSTGSWKFANYMGNNRNNEYAAAVMVNTISHKSLLNTPFFREALAVAIA